jgi:hypothetical protein
MASDGKLGTLRDVRNVPVLEYRSLYTGTEIKHVEKVTGRVYVGSFENEDGHFVPVFSKEEHDGDDTQRP